MELREFALRVLQSDQLNLKLQRPDRLSDSAPGAAMRIELPVRPSNLQFAPRKTAPAMPKGQALHAPQKRTIAHHIMANHELQALEVMAMVLVTFPDAPPEFRMGLAEIMIDEQRHTRLHASRCSQLGTEFGDLPVNGYIWKKAADYSTVLEYIAGLPLVFEGANLDHTIEFQEYFLTHGDQRGADILKAIHLDEIRHVEFGLHWLRQLKPQGTSDYDAWLDNLHWPIRAASAKGEQFQKQARRNAGMDDDFINRLMNASKEDLPNRPT